MQPADPISQMVDSAFAINSNTSTSSKPQAKIMDDPVPLYTTKPPEPTSATIPESNMQNLDYARCTPSRIVAITVPPRGNYGNLTDANEEEFHFVTHFYEKVQLFGEIENVYCYRECLPNGSTKNRMIVVFRDIQSAIECTQLHDQHPYMSTKRLTRCQFVPLEVYEGLKSLRPE